MDRYDQACYSLRGMLSFRVGIAAIRFTAWYPVAVNPLYYFSVIPN